MLDVCELEVHDTVRLDVYTPQKMLQDMGVSEAYVSGMDLITEQVIVIRKHVSTN